MGIRNSVRKSWLVYSSFLFALIFLIYGNTIGWPFVSDDYQLLNTAKQGLVESISYVHGWYHYMPTSTLAIFLWSQLFGMSPTSMHILVLLTHWANGILVAALAMLLIRRQAVAWVSGVIFVTSGLVYEVPLWATGAFYSVPVLFYLIGIISYVLYCRSMSARWLMLFWLCVLVSLFGNEQAITLILACVLYRLFIVKDMKSQPLENWSTRTQLSLWLRDFGIPAATILLFVGLRSYLFSTAGTKVFLGDQSISNWFYLLRFSIIRLLLPTPGPQLAYAVAHLGHPAPGARITLWIALIAGTTVWFLRTSHINRFLLLWMLVHTAITEFAAGNVASRYFYLPLVPAAILFANVTLELTVSVFRKLRPSGYEPHSTQFNALFTIIFSVVVLIASVPTLLDRKHVWKVASAVAGGIITDINENFLKCAKCSEIHLVGLPDGIETGDIDVAYIFRNGITDALRMAQIPEPVMIIEHDTLNANELQRLACDPKKLVMQYDPAKLTIGRKWSIDMCPPDPGN